MLNIFSGHGKLSTANIMFLEPKLIISYFLEMTEYYFYPKCYYQHATRSSDRRVSISWVLIFTM
jgi:hypothetical protein